MSVVAGGSLVIAAAMGLLAYATLLARNEAQQQRAEAIRARDDAEGLIEFMLTDLRQKLDAVGRLDANHLRAVLGEHHAGHRSRHARAELENAHPVESLHHPSIPFRARSERRDRSP